MPNYINDNKSTLSKKSDKPNFNFKRIKKNTLCSLNEVECFLNKFNKFSNCIKLYKIFK